MAVVENIQSTFDIPILPLSWLNARDDRMVSSFLQAAENPYAAAHILVGRDSAIAMASYLSYHVNESDG
jgi:hypothetical protein